MNESSPNAENIYKCITFILLTIYSYAKKATYIHAGSILNPSLPSVNEFDEYDMSASEVTLKINIKENINCKTLIIGYI